jgi:1-acyl-sn-glycerol-3-phosphate acyltransferase
VQYRTSRLVAGPVLHMLARPRITGAENIPATGPAIVASNHLSVVDSIFLPFMLERTLVFAAKSEYFTGTRLRDRAIATYLRATNQLSVDRTEARAAQDMLESALSLLRAGELFGIYPEGTRSPDGRLYRGRPGVGWLALNSGAPVIPVAGSRSGWASRSPSGGSRVPARSSGASSPTRSSRPSRSCPGRNTCPCTRPSARTSSPPSALPARAEDPPLRTRPSGPAAEDPPLRTRSRPRAGAARRAGRAAT